jgi:hypothetical protein
MLLMPAAQRFNIEHLEMVAPYRAQCSRVHMENHFLIHNSHAIHFLFLFHHLSSHDAICNFSIDCVNMGIAGPWHTSFENV